MIQKSLEVDRKVVSINGSCDRIELSNFTRWILKKEYDGGKHGKRTTKDF